ncbi:cyclic-phosphate processing receiver domain-containing protein [Prescottella equi]|uniref:cyclic-phosphate processing receiver domain-containing protein n=1 Tax=Rhodococcus hoagii TaxID=43767 RepID=UPI0023DAA10E|nr:cyclic-phosphate processing receiver domain-containing protein [Prescottella equi]
MKLWVDDLRTPPPGWEWAKSSAEAIEALQTGKVTALSLDHDLGGDDTTRPVVLWMCEHEIWPTVVRVHSANPVGVEWLTGMIDRYQPSSD